jgi:C4-dicarboxylate transporter DctQ subunit
MNPLVHGAVEWVRRRAENIVAGLLGLMFLAFLVQIVFRYFLDLPVGWTAEFSVIAWLYMVLVGSALWLREGEEIRFDLLSDALGATGRRVIGVIAGTAAVVLFALSLPASWKYVTFMKVESTSYLKIRLDWLYAVYLVFVVAVIVRYAWSTWRALRGPVEPLDVTERGYGL